jgi:hypothetical protein
MRKYSICAQSWPLKSDPNSGKDKEIGKAILAASVVLDEAMRGSRKTLPANTRVVGSISLGTGGVLRDRYQGTWFKKQDLIMICVNGDLHKLRKLCYEKLVCDISVAFLAALCDYCRRRKLPVDNLDAQLSRLGPRPDGTGFLNLLGDIKTERDDGVLTNKEVILSIPLSTKGCPVIKDYNRIDKFESLLARRIKSAGQIGGHESGNGSVEFFLTCDTHAPLVQVLREMVGKGELPTSATAVARNLKTNCERPISLIMKNQSLRTNPNLLRQKPSKKAR